MKRSLFFIIIWMATIRVGFTQSDSSLHLMKVKDKLKKTKLLEKNRFRTYNANVFKKDKSIMDTGVLWDVNTEKIILLPKDQFRKWKKNKLQEDKLTFIEVSTQNTRLVKIHPKSDLRRTGLAGFGVGIVLGIPIGLIRQSAYSKNGCDGSYTEPPSGIECIGGREGLNNYV